MADIGALESDFSLDLRDDYLAFLAQLGGRGELATSTLIAGPDVADAGARSPDHGSLWRTLLGGRFLTTA